MTFVTGGFDGADAALEYCTLMPRVTMREPIWGDATVVHGALYPWEKM
jgi:hypothetical protein